jgi:ABC-type uncharacterized transport system permease subunit
LDGQTFFSTFNNKDIGNSDYDDPLTLPKADFLLDRAQHTTNAICAQTSHNSPSMALSNVGSLVLSILIFITTLVNFSYALTSLDSLVVLGLYAISKIFVTPPEEGIFAQCQHRHLYPDG